MRYFSVWLLRPHPRGMWNLALLRTCLERSQARPCRSDIPFGFARGRPCPTDFVFNPYMRHPERRRTSADGGILRGSLTPVVLHARFLVPLMRARHFGRAQIHLLMLTTEALVSKLPEEKKAAPVPGGHGGMGRDMY